MLQIETDQLDQSLEQAGLDEKQRKQIRCAMRVAMMSHDLGKVYNVNTPGSHEGVGAKLFRRYKPAWIDPETAKLAEWVIRTHDLFGRLARGVTEKEGRRITDPDFDVTAMTTYKGGLDPEAVREELLESGLPLPVAAAIHKAVWRSDVSSVSSLRWILPVADTLERLVLAEESQKA
jgi:hypothetical protein